MPFNGSGVFNRALGPDTWKTDAAAGTKIRADLHDNSDNDIAGGLTFAICKDGQSQIGADIPWNGKKITNLGAAGNPTDAVQLQQVQAYNATTGANPSGIIVSGSTPNSVIKFTGTTGPWGDSYVTADLAFGAKVTDTWVWNDKADFSGTDIMTLNAAGTSTLTLNTVDAGATPGPTLMLDRFSATPAASDSIGQIYFRGRNSLVAVTDYARILVQANDVTNATEDGTMILGVQVAGTLTTRFLINAAGASVTGALDVTGAVTLASVTATGTVAADAVTSGGTTVATSGVGQGLAMRSDGNLLSKRNGTAAALHAQFFNNAAVSIAAVGNITSTGSVTAYNTSSDEELKDFIGPYDPASAIEIIRADPVRDFTWKSSGEYAVGWGAQTSYSVSQDLATPPPPRSPEDVAIEGVGTDPKEPGYQPWGMDQAKRTPYLWAALSWALDRIDDLTARVEALEA